MADTTRAIVAPELSTEGGQITTTSMQIAEHFGKRHADVLRAIKNLLPELSEDHKRNFAFTVQTRANPSGGAPISFPCYRITRDGFTLLAMGFTGKEALHWKLAYIDAFNRMEAEIHARAAALPRKEMTVNEMVKKMTRQLETGNSYPPILFMPLVEAVMRKSGKRLVEVAPGQMVVDRRKLAAVWADLGKLQSRIDAMGCPAQDFPPSWWEQKSIAA